MPIEIEICGLHAYENGCSCDEHEICGKYLCVGDKVRLILKSVEGINYCAYIRTTYHP